MKKIALHGLFVLIAASPMGAAAQNVEGQIIAAQYGTWTVPGYSPNDFKNFAPSSCRVQGGNSFFSAFSVGTAIKIVDGNPALNETVTPTAAEESNVSCSVTIAPQNKHTLPFYLTSATGGLQEALNANASNPGPNTILLNNQWYQLGGSAAIIASVKGSANLGLEDVTTTPTTWYRWSGTQYVQVAMAAGGGTSSFNPYMGNTLAAAIGANDTSLTLTGPTAGYPPFNGTLLIGQEWINYDSLVGQEATGLHRGYHVTMPASHPSGAFVQSIVASFDSPTQPPVNFVAFNPGSGVAPFTANCSYADIANNPALQVNCPGSTETIISGFDGTINQQGNTGFNQFHSPVGIGPSGGEAHIADSGNLMDITRQNQSTVPMGFPSLAGPVISKAVATVGAPTVLNLAGTGSTTYTYVCVAVDIDGHLAPGTPATITNGPDSYAYPQEMTALCPWTAGAVYFQLWRTAGYPNTGFLNTLLNGQSFQDFATLATPGSLPTVNTSVAKQCVGSEASCWISGANPPPTGGNQCTNGWFYTNQSGNPATLYDCENQAWVPFGTGTSTTLNALSGAVTVASPDNSVQIVSSGQQIQLKVAGTAGSGTISPAAQYSCPLYTVSGSVATVAGTGYCYTLVPGMTSAQVNTVISGLAATQEATVYIPDGFPQVPFNNQPTAQAPYGINIVDNRTGSNYKQLSGIACDGVFAYGTVAAGSSTFNIEGGPGVTPAITGATLGLAYVDANGNQYVFEPTVTYVSQYVLTLSAPAQWTFPVGFGDGRGYPLGHENSATLDADMNALSGPQSQQLTGLVPGGCGIVTHAFHVSNGASFIGTGGLSAHFIGLPGEDIIQGGTGALSTGSQQVQNLWLDLNSTVDATHLINIEQANGTVTTNVAQNTELYRPLGVQSVESNDPRAPFWSTGGFNGVAATTASQSVICVPSSETLPTAGNPIVFPFMSPTGWFNTTVSSTSGSGCAAGSNAVTLADPMPSGSTITQNEWFSASTFQTTAISIPSGTITYPYELYVNLPATRTPQWHSNFAGHGRIKINGVQYDYFDDFGQFSLSAVATSSGGNAVYTGTFNASAAGNNWAGLTFTVSGFSTAANNGSFTVVASSTTSLTLANANAVAQAQSATLTSNTQWMTLIHGPTTVASTLPAGDIAFPLNPCGDDNGSVSNYPWPVLPTLNMGPPVIGTPNQDAQFYPGFCVGNAALSNPVPNAFVSTGSNNIFNSDWSHITVTVGANGDAMETAAYYSAGGDDMYGDKFDFWKINNTQYGIVQGPASIGQSVFNAFGLTGAGNTISNCSIRAGIIFAFINWQQSVVSQCDTYTALEYNGWQLENSGAAEAVMLGFAYDETGTNVGLGTNILDPVNGSTGQDSFREFNSEPENGDHHGGYWYSDLQTSQLVVDNSTWEGCPNFLAGNLNHILNSQFSGQPGCPIVVTGSANTFTNDMGLNIGRKYASWNSQGSFFDWGQNTSASFSPNSSGLNIAKYLSPSVAAIEKSSGLDVSALNTLNLTWPFQNHLQTFFGAEDFSTNFSLDAGAMQQGWTLDPTEPLRGSYAGCNVTTSGGCQPNHYDGSLVYIGQNQTVQPTKYLAVIEFKDASIAQNVTFQVAVQNDGTNAGCSIGFQSLLQQQLPATTSWQQRAYVVDFTGYSGCFLVNGFGPAATANDQLRLGYIYYMPIPQELVLNPATAGTWSEGNFCIAPGVLGIDSSDKVWFCTYSNTQRYVQLQ